MQRVDISTGYVRVNFFQVTYLLMPRNTVSRREKAEVRERVEEQLGTTDQAATRRRDWRISQNGNTSVFLTFSRSDQLFYDVNRDDLDEWREFDQAFVIFVMGTADDVIVVPVPVLDAHLRSEHHPAEGGNYKLHIEGEGRQLTFRELPSLNLSHYRNSYAQLNGLGRE